MKLLERMISSMHTTMQMNRNRNAMEVVTAKDMLMNGVVGSGRDELVIAVMSPVNMTDEARMRVCSDWLRWSNMSRSLSLPKVKVTGIDKGHTHSIAADRKAFIEDK